MNVISVAERTGIRFKLVKDERELRDLLAEVTLEMGFEHFALNHHVDLAGPPDDAISLMNYHPGWVDLALSHRYHIDDPVHAASTKTAIGFLWREVPNMVPLSGRQLSILTTARDFGLCEGYTVPVHVPGDYRGTASFASRTFSNLSVRALNDAQLIGGFAFEAARRLMKKRSGILMPARLPQLSQRQLDCVSLVGRGKGDWEISKILSLSKATAHQHVEEARRRYQVAKRTQLVVRALFDGQISFGSVLAGSPSSF